MKSLAVVSCVCFLMFLAAKIDGRATIPYQVVNTPESISRVAKIHRQVHHMANDEPNSIDNHLKQLAIVQEDTGKSVKSSEGTSHQSVKRLTETPVEKPLTINWKSLVVVLTEVAHKMFEFIYNNFKKLQQRLLNIIVPLFSMLSGPQSPGHPTVATSTSIDWRSAGTALFNTLVKFQNVRTNEV